MIGISTKCPHCGTVGAFFQFRNEYKDLNDPFIWHLVSTCGVCKSAALIILRDNNGTGVKPMSWAVEHAVFDRFDFKALLPEAPKERIPSGIPENVSPPLSEAEQCYVAGHYSAAASCYRKAIERSVKAILPTEKGSLYNRIRKLESGGLLPTSMIHLLDEVRIFGNEAVHDEDIDPSREDCAAARDFVDLFLTYAFSLPQKVAMAKEARPTKKNLESVKQFSQELDHS